MANWKRQRIFDRLAARLKLRRDALTEGDVLAAVQLSSLTPLYLPWSGSAISPVTARTLCNDVLLNGRKRILEFGPGISTVLLTELAQQHGLDLEITAVDEDDDWLSSVDKNVRTFGSSASVDLVHAPLVPFVGAAPFPVARWYARDPLSTIEGPFDLVLVDGPTAYRRDWCYDRWPALDFVEERLSDCCSLILDDTDRPGERAIVDNWAGSLGVDFSRRESPQATWLTRGSSWST